MRSKNCLPFFSQANASKRFLNLLLFFLPFFFTANISLDEKMDLLVFVKVCKCGANLGL